MAIRGHGAVLPCGLGRPGGFACQEVWTKLLWLSQNRSKVMAVPPAAFVPPGCREKGGMVGMCRAPAPPSWPQDEGFSAPMSV